ncbi:hypothetical protein [Thioalkalivibrio sp. HK1]|uniref:hypothetical protein n=1 Tax=Thioalkalivibrio sp. HK1 TaxID=1469245 RepID=UPI00046F401F|nr:hypothetical protein [Thioalkalivibrio sp. HK1]
MNAQTSGSRPISKDESADLRVAFADLRADIIASNERTRTSYERNRADVIASNKDSDIMRATWIAEARASRSVFFWGAGIGVGVGSILIGVVGLWLGFPDAITRFFGG